MNRISVVVGLLLTLSSAGYASAAQQDASQKIVVDAKKQSVDIKNNVVTFYDKVVVQQGTMRIEADRLEVHQYQDKGAERLIAIGNPAKFSQMMENGKPIHGQANQVQYTLSKRSITLTGDAMLKQEESEVRGETISYDINNERLIAESGEANEDRVRTIFLPDQIQSLGEATPQPSPTPTEDEPAPSSEQGDESTPTLTPEIEASADPVPAEEAPVQEEAP